MEDNPKELFRHLITQFRGIPIDELEIDTIIELDSDKEWNEKKEIYSAFLTLIRRPDHVAEDPNLFAQVALALSGMPPDFLEFEFLTPEIIAVFFRTLEYIKLYYPEFIFPPLSDDITKYVAICCAEDGFYFLENELSVFQSDLIEVLTNVYNNKPKEEDILKCKALWKEFKNTNAINISEKETNPDMIQIQKNLIIKDYLKELFS